MPHIIVHCSNKNLGGAEKSFLNQLQISGILTDHHFITPGNGWLTDEIAKLGSSFTVIPFPVGLESLTQKNFGVNFLRVVLMPSLLFAWIKYIKQLNKAQKGFAEVRTLGVKSHCLMLYCNLFSNRRIALSIRDFIQPVWVRRLISRICRVKGYRVEVNSKRVGMDYYQPEIVYPRIFVKGKKNRSPRKNNKLIVTHLAYFAPYKGQMLFVEFARQLTARGVEAEYRIVGDVIYSGSEYRDYKQEISDKIIEYGLDNSVNMLGQVSDPENLLRESDLLVHCTLEPEPFGRVVLEALLCGCDVVCHNQNGCLELISNISGVQDSLLSGVADPQQYCFLRANEAKINYPD